MWHSQNDIVEGLLLNENQDVERAHHDPPIFSKVYLDSVSNEEVVCLHECAARP